MKREDVYTIKIQKEAFAWGIGGIIRYFLKIRNHTQFCFVLPIYDTFRMRRKKFDNLEQEHKVFAHNTYALHRVSHHIMKQIFEPPMFVLIDDPYDDRRYKSMGNLVDNGYVEPFIVAQHDIYGEDKTDIIAAQVAKHTGSSVLMYLTDFDSIRLNGEPVREILRDDLHLYNPEGKLKTMFEGAQLCDCSVVIGSAKQYATGAIGDLISGVRGTTIRWKTVSSKQ